MWPNNSCPRESILPFIPKWLIIYGSESFPYICLLAKDSIWFLRDLVKSALPAKLVPLILPAIPASKSAVRFGYIAFILSIILCTTTESSSTLYLLAIN
jgi:hypothetical protein